MYEPKKTLGVKKVSGESRISFRSRIECLMAEYGFFMEGTTSEKNGYIIKKLYSGPRKSGAIVRFLDDKYVGGGLTLPEVTAKGETFDAFISFDGITERVVEQFNSDLVKLVSG